MREGIDHHHTTSYSIQECISYHITRAYFMNLPCQTGDNLQQKLSAKSCSWITSALSSILLQVAYALLGQHHPKKTSQIPPLGLQDLLGLSLTQQLFRLALRTPHSASGVASGEASGRVGRTSQAQFFRETECLKRHPNIEHPKK